MKTTVKRVNLPDDRRILMISDIHGHAEGLQAVLDQAGFCPKDVLIIVGDMIEKGSESLRTLRLIMQLCQTHTVYPLIGNVDMWRLEGLLSDDPVMQKRLLQYSLKAQGWWNTSFLGELCAEAGISLTADMDTACTFRQLREHFAGELSFLASLPTALETQNMIFVHGGIPHERLDELAGQEAHSLLKYDHFYDEGLAFKKYVVVGHWPVTLYSKSHPCNKPIIDGERRIICLDGGCGLKNDGQLNLLAMPDWRTDTFQLYSWCGLPTITALDPQEASVSCGYIRWGDNEVSVIEKRGGFARILHHGREMTVPESFLYKENERTFCDDITDYQLAVFKGDALSLVLNTPQGCYVKKNGVTGWYMGRYAENK